MDLRYPSRKLVVEVDGGQRLEQTEYDDARTRELERLGYRVIRFWNNNVFANLDAVLNAIVAEVEAAAAPSPGWHPAWEQNQAPRHPPSPATKCGRGEDKD